MPIQFAFFESPLGIIDVKLRNDKLCLVSFRNTLKNNKTTSNEFETASAIHPVLLECEKQLKEYFAGTRKQFDLPLEQEGSAFQQSVWAELLKIPYGRTISYMELSKRIKNVKAIRAVGTANGCNSIAIIVPCHRVIGSDGSLTGYAGDLWRKQWLLEHENKFANGVVSLF